MQSDLKVYEYQNGTLSNILINEPVIDISANNTSVMYQTIDEKIYVTGENTFGELGVGNTSLVNTPVQVTKHSDNVFGMGSGYYNTYIIENTGNVYATGNNEYGSLGNGTRISEVEHILVGDRNFKVEPITATMKVGDKEQIEIKGNPFNVFGNTNISLDEYIWESDDENVISVISGTLEALSKGTAHITVTDKVTNEELIFTRIVTDIEKDRIDKITVNGETALLDEASTENNLIYRIKVITNENKGQLQITTKDLTDRISIDEGQNWSYNGILSQEIDILEKETSVNIKLGVKNNNGDYPLEENYTLIIEKVTDDIAIKEITVTSKDNEGNENVVIAKPVSLTRYEVVVSENTDISLSKVVLNSDYSYVSIDGAEYNIKSVERSIQIGTEFSKEIAIAVKSEAGRYEEYTLVIYKENVALDLISLKVNDTEAKKISEGNYAITVPKETSNANIKAIVNNSIAEISIAGNSYTPRINEENLNLNLDTTIVTIKTRTNNGYSKEYTLTIQKESDSQITPKLDMLLVNGKVIEPEEDNLTYITYLPSAEVSASIWAIAKENTVKVKIDENTEEIGESQVTIDVRKKENIYNVILSDDENSVTYKVIIRKAEADTNLKEITLSFEDTVYKAIKQTNGQYIAKIPADISEIDVTGVTSYAKSKIQIENSGIYVIHEDTKRIEVSEDVTNVSIKVESEDGSLETEYILQIQKMSTNTNLLKVEVDGNNVVLGDDGNYHYILTDAKNSVLVGAYTEDKEPNKAWVNIDNSPYDLYEIAKQIDITSKQTESIIKVKAEDGTIKSYKLIIEGLPDDCSIKEVVVNGELAKYIEGKNRYEIRNADKSYEIEVTLNDLLASMVLGENEKSIGKDNITVTKTGKETIVKVKVTSQNGLETEEYTIAILEKSSNSNLDMVIVNGDIVTPSLDGTYNIKVVNTTADINIEAISEDKYAITTIDNVSNNSYIAKKEEAVVDGKTIYEYKITVIAEDKTTADYTLTVEIGEANYNITNVFVGETQELLEEARLREDGKYYYKIGNVNEAYVKVKLESEKSKSKINGEIGDVVKVRLPNLITEIQITILGEDETVKEYTLIIEKKSSDVSIKSVTGDDVLKVENQNADIISVYVDEDVVTTNLDIVLNNKFASLKLSNEEEYSLNNIIREVDLSEYVTSGVIILGVDVKAEDGSTKQYQIQIYKQSNLDLDKVIINDENINYNEQSKSYEAVVTNGNKPIVTITAKNTLQTLQLLDINGNILATGVGTINTNLNLNTASLSDSYIIKVISHNGEAFGYEEYNLNIRQKSTENGILYIKVDELGTILNEDGLTYSAQVAGKDEYPVEIKLKDENSKVRIEDLEGNILVKEQIGTLSGMLTVLDGETKEVKVIVTSENGEEKEYKLNIERISSNLDVESITVTDYDNEKENIITKNVTIYDVTSKTYKIVLTKDLTETQVKINAISNFTTITLDNIVTGKGTVISNVNLLGLGITRFTIELTAADGKQETRYLEIIQLSDEIGIKTVEVDKVKIQPNEAGNYEVVVTDEIDLANVKVMLLDTTSKVSVNGNKEELGESIVDISKGANRQLVIPIIVTSQDGTSHTYTLTLNIISSDTTVKTVKGDEEIAKFENEKYVVYIDKNATNVGVEIIAGVPYSTISHTSEEGEELSDKSRLEFNLENLDLNQERFETKFLITAEDRNRKRI